MEVITEYMDHSPLGKLAIYHFNKPKNNVITSMDIGKSFDETQ